MGMSENYWKQPLRWNEQAKQVGKRRRVFCASMADVFEDHSGVVEWRERLWSLIEQTPMLNWQLLTKRPENINRMIPLHWQAFPRDNVWYGTSCEDQERADRRIAELLKVNSLVRFLSC
jgi:protein gp37